MARIEARSLDIPFRAAFNHASARRAATCAVWVAAAGHDGGAGHGEGTPREYVTGESLAGAARFVATHRGDWLARVHDVATLAAWGERNAGAIDADPAAWCAVELALLDLFGRRAGRPLDVLLGLPPLAGSARYTAVLGDAPAQGFAAQLARYLGAGFETFKVKLSGDAARDAAKVRALREAGVAPAAVRADANNLWTDAAAAIAHLAALDYPFRAIEEPLRAGDVAGMRRIATACAARIVLDESLTRADQLDAFAADAARWIVNVRVSKMGGLLRSLAVVERAAALGIDTIVGAHVGETSVLTRAALTVAAAAAGQARLLAREGAFGEHLLAHDVVAEPIAFGAGGRLDVGGLACVAAPGLGLRIRVRPEDLAALPGPRPVR